MHTVLLAVACFLWPTFGQELSEEILDQIESRLTDTCGSRCISVFNDLRPLLGHQQPNTTDGVMSEYAAFNAYLKKYLTDGWAQNDQIMKGMQEFAVSSFAKSEPPHLPGKVRKHRPPAQPGVPCATQAECDAMDFKLNKCSHLRQSALKAYTGCNTVVMVMANMITVVCGCIFAGPAKVCVLRAIPYVCGFPFMAYEGVYGLSQSLWTAVSMLSATCTTGGGDMPFPT